MRRPRCAGLLDSAVLLDNFFGLFDGGVLALDMGENRVDLRRLAQDFGLEAGDKTVCLKQRHLFIELNVLLHAQASMVRLHAQFMHARRCCARPPPDAVEDAFGPGLARHRYG